MEWISEEKTYRPSSSFPEEVRLLFSLAIPVVFSQIGQFLLGFVDIVMVGHYSEEALAAVTLGSSFSMTILLLGMGLMFGLDPLISQAYGAGHFKACGSHMQAGILTAFLISLPVMVLFFYSPHFLRSLGQKESLCELGGTYVQTLIPGVFPYFLFLSFRQFLQSLGKMKPAMYVIFLVNGINLGVNWLLIYGNWGCPELGAQGAAYATMLCKILMGSLLFIYVWNHPEFQKYPWVPRWKDFPWDSLRKLFSTGIPLAMQMGLEILAFTSVTFLMGWLGTRELGGHQIALNLASFSFMVPVGIGASACVRIGHGWGANHLAGCKLSVKSALFLVLFTASFSAFLFAFFPLPLARLYTNQPPLVEMAIILLPLAALFQIADGIQCVSFGILRGVGDTRLPMITLVIGFWVIGLPLGYFWTFHEGMGPRGLWWGFVIGLFLVAALLLFRIYVVLWKRHENFS